MIKYIEQWGTGTNDMIAACINWGLPEPKFELVTGNLVVSFRKDIFTEDYLKTMGLNERQKKAVEFIKTEKKITRTEYEKMSGISERTANRELSDLVKLSIFNKIGKGPNVYYELTKISPNLAKKMLTLLFASKKLYHKTFRKGLIQRQPCFSFCKKEKV